MDVLLDTTNEYLKTREQFGQPIGKFQAVQHRMADMYLRVEEVRSLLYNAAIALEHEGIAAYQIAATSGLLDPAVVDIGVTFQGHHKGHRDALVSAVQAQLLLDMPTSPAGGESRAPRTSMLDRPTH